MNGEMYDFIYYAVEHRIFSKLVKIIYVKNNYINFDKMQPL